jgi:dihydroxy-acid dehydratase
MTRSSTDGPNAERQGLKPRSYEVTEGPARAPARAMLRAVGMTDEDWGKPQIGVASSWNEVTPCNMSLDRLAKRSKEGVRAAGGFPLEFVTIAVSDGISMGHEGMRASLVSREVIADSVETVMHAERFDGLVTFAGCDKSLPGMLMAAARVNLPSVFLYGGSIMPGRLGDQALDIVSVFEAVGANAVGALSDATPVRRSALVPGCLRPTPWPRFLKPSGCHSPAVPRCRRWTAGWTTWRTGRAKRSCPCSRRGSDLGRF